MLFVGREYRLKQKILNISVFLKLLYYPYPPKLNSNEQEVGISLTCYSNSRIYAILITNSSHAPVNGKMMMSYSTAQKEK